MFEGVSIGINDSNGNPIHNGDKVKGIRRHVMPNWDGWGMDIPSNRETSYHTEELEGEVIFWNGRCNDRAEFVVNTRYGTREFYWFDRLEIMDV